jgi:O-antigen/teichoic acid export membrane protein
MTRGLVDFLCVAVPKVLGGTGTVVANLVLLRVFAPEQFGVYALCVAGVFLFDEIVGAAFDVGVLRLAPLYRRTDPSRSFAIERAALLLKGGVGLTVGLVLILFADPLSRGLLQRDGAAHLVYVSASAALAMLVLRSALVNLQVDHRFSLYGALDLLNSVLRFGGLALLLIFAEASPASVLALFAVAPACVFLVWLLVHSRPVLQWRPRRAAVLGELLASVKWFLLTFVLAGLVARLDVFLLGTLADAREVGVFAGGQTLALIPELVGTYLAVVLSPRVMPYLREGRFLWMFRRVQLGLAGAAVAIYGFAWLTRDLLTTYVLPTSFAASAPVVLILLPGALAGMATFPLTVSFLMFVRPRFLFVLDCLTAPVMAVLYLYAIQHHGAIGAAWVTSLSRFVKAAAAQLRAWPLARQSPEDIAALPVPLGP